MNTIDMYMEPARTAIYVRRRALERGFNDSHAAVMADIDQYLQDVDETQRDEYLRRVLANEVHLSRDLDELEVMEFEAAINDSDTDQFGLMSAQFGDDEPGDEFAA